MLNKFLSLSVILIIIAETLGSPLKSRSNFDDDCGIQAKGYTVGGEVLDPHRFPW